MDIKFISTAVVKRAIPVIFLCGGMLVANMAHAGWLADWIKCSEDCGWICNCDGGEGGKLAIQPQNAEEKKASVEIMKVMESFKSNVRSLSPEAKKLLKKLDSKGR